MNLQVSSQLSTLSHPGRMAVLRLLMRRYPDAVPAGEIRDVLALKPSTTSTYLGALTQARLITQTRVATSLQYRANVGAMQALMGYLLDDCCQGRADLNRAKLRENCSFNVLFLGSGNAARSILAESILRAEAGDRFRVFSAGTKPDRKPNPQVLDMLSRMGHDTAGLFSKSIDDICAPAAPMMDFVFTVCDDAANQDRPRIQPHPLTAHWGMRDPVADGSGPAFQHALDCIRSHIRAFIALPFDTLDRPGLQIALDTMD